MMKGLVIQQQNQVVEENMSNLTSASGEASGSSSNRAEPLQYFAPPSQTQPAMKKKRNLPGNPDPGAEVIALSPKTLLATNRFVCEICKKGFQRDQNLQLHRRGHNLPWKLKQRTSKEVRKKVYVCPEASCAHHDPTRALGDLTGIKKHFFRKHGEKKWKCEKCSKKYAVRSDWKAHSKTCGTKEYRCDCGTLFSRRDSFITHKAFCDVLAEESARRITGNPLLPCQTGTSTSNIINLQVQVPQFNSHDLHAIPMKNELQNFNLKPQVPPWLVFPGPPPPIDLSSSIFSTRSDQEFTQHQEFTPHENPSPSPCTSPSPNPSLGPTLLPYHPIASPHMSATALLQKAAQMGATMSTKMKPHQGHVPADSGTHTAGFGLNLYSREEMGTSGYVHGLSSLGNKAAVPTAGTGAPPPTLLQDMMSSHFPSDAFATGLLGSSLEDTFGGMLNSKTSSIHYEGGGGGNSGRGSGNDMTRDFLGLRPLSHSDILSIAGLTNHVKTCENQNQTQKSWQG